MSTVKPCNALLFLLLALACSRTEIVPSIPAEVQEKNGDNYFIPGRVSVQFDENTTRLIEDALSQGENPATKSSQMDGIFSGLGVRSMRRVFPDAGQWEPRTRKEGLHRFYYVEFDEAVPVTRATADLSGLGGVVSVSPQLPVKRRAFFNDPYYGSQWHFANGRYSGADINVEKVWEQFTTGSDKVIVSVVDEGVLSSHEDLAPNIVPGYDDGSGSYNFNNNTPDLVPTQGHGTHVAGVIAAVSNNSLGVAGIAGGDAAKNIPGVKVLSCQIFDLYGAEPDIYQALKHGADHGAVILQCSWGFSPDLNGDGFTSDEEISIYRSYTIADLPEYKAAIDYFIKYAGCDNDGNQLPDSPMKGGVVVFAAGNDNFDYDPLVSYEPIIAVGAFGATGNKASYSNYGDWLDIAAPGGDAKQGIYSTILGNNYGGADWQGTSMACPHVSGVAALLASYFGGPGFTAEECRARLLRGSKAGYFTGSRYIGRKLDAYGAFTVDLNAPVNAPVLSWTGPATAELPHNGTAGLQFSCTDPQGQHVFLYVSPELPGVSVEEDKLVVDASLLQAGSYAIKLTAANEDHALTSITATVNILANRPPEITSSMPVDGIMIQPGKEAGFELWGWFSDPDDESISLSAASDNPDILSVKLDEDGHLTLEGLSEGVCALAVSAGDAEGKTARVSIPVAVVGNAEKPFLFPALASTRVSVCYDAAGSEVEMVLRSATGALLQTKSVRMDIFHPVSISVSDYAPGYYTITLKSAAGTQSVSFAKI